MNNAESGKTMENLRNRIDVELASSRKNYLKWTSKPSHMLHKRFDNDLVAISTSKVQLTYNGMYIMDLRKVLMYEFHYDYIIKSYGNNSRLLFTDNDSLMYDIKTKDVYEDFSNDKEMFGYSNYSTWSKYYDSHKLVVGRMKDETAGDAIKEFVGLKPNMYSFLVDDCSEHKKANVVATKSHNEYKDVC